MASDPGARLILALCAVWYSANKRGRYTSANTRAGLHPLGQLQLREFVIAKQA